ncbi:hypothetical protein BC834DRAFT_661220 [Gloeopeniophorella convolvens]|nr:hypothetical protein BC834DRAFT_299599 [Gloeopeniophorella convolvens]KAI0259129.1 hypothetical protein BC834DRAFT_661220 [Gloeopeniophorella convolvens]
MDRFWIDEIRRVSKALKNCQVDQEDIGRWNGFRTSLDQTIASWKSASSGGDDSWSPPLKRSRASTASDVGAIATSLAPAVGAMRNALESVRMSTSAAFVKSAQQSLILQTQFKFATNAQSCLVFLQRCAAYGEMMVLSCTTSIAPFASPRATASQDLCERIAQLQSGAPATPTEGAVEETHSDAINPAASRKFFSTYAQSLSLLHGMDSKLGALLGRAATWMATLDALDTPQPEPTLQQLRKMSRAWLKRRDSLREVLAATAEDDQTDATITRGSLSARLRSVVTRGMRIFVSFS